MTNFITAFDQKKAKVRQKGLLTGKRGAPKPKCGFSTIVFSHLKLINFLIKICMQFCIVHFSQYIRHDIQ